MEPPVESWQNSYRPSKTGQSSPTLTGKKTQQCMCSHLGNKHETRLKQQDKGVTIKLRHNIHPLTITAVFQHLSNKFQTDLLKSNSTNRTQGNPDGSVANNVASFIARYFRVTNNWKQSCLIMILPRTRNPNATEHRITATEVALGIKELW